MSINAITSFRGQDFETLANSEVTYKADSPIASNPVKPDTYEKSGSSTGKKIAWTTAILLAGAATLGILSKNGKLFNNMLEEGAVAEGFANKTKQIIAKVGDWLSEKAYIGKAWDTVKGWLSKAEKAAAEATESAAK